MTRLTHSLAYGDPAVREQAARDLAGCGVEAVDPLLSHGINDADRTVRIASALSLLLLAPTCHISFQDRPQSDPEVELWKAVIEARSRKQDGASELRSALDQHDHKRREAAIRVIDLLIRGLPDEAERRPFTDLLISSIEHKRRDIRTGALRLLQLMPVPGSIPALFSRLRRVRRLDNNLEGTIGACSLIAFAALSLSKYAPPPFSTPHALFESHAWIPIALMGAFVVFIPLSYVLRVRARLLAASAELLEVMRALDRQDLALAEGALKDLKSIASLASGHSPEARGGARELIRRVEAAKSQHGPLPIPAAASEPTTTDGLPVSVAEIRRGD